MLEHKLDLCLCAPSSAGLCWNVGESQPRFFVFIGFMSRSRTKTANSCSNFFSQSAQGIITSSRNTKSNSRLYLVGYACSWLAHSLLNTVCRLHLGTKVFTDSVRIDSKDTSKASRSQSTWRRNYNLANKWTPIEADEVEPQIRFVWLVLLRIHRNDLITDRSKERERVREINSSKTRGVRSIPELIFSA